MGSILSLCEAGQGLSLIICSCLMKAQPIDWRDPNFVAKLSYYILEVGINPITGKAVTPEEKQTAEWYNRIHPLTEALSWGVAIYSAYMGYNQYYNKPYTTLPKAFGKGKDWIKAKLPGAGSQPARANMYSTVEVTFMDKGLKADFPDLHLSKIRKYRIIRR